MFFELRISPAPAPYTFDVSLGSLATWKTPAGGFTGGVGSGLIIQASATGGGVFEARLRPTAGYGPRGASYQIAVVVETKTASGSKDAPASYTAWLGTSLAPLTDFGVSYSSVWGDALSAIVKRLCV